MNCVVRTEQCRSSHHRVCQIKMAKYEKHQSLRRQVQWTSPAAVVSFVQTAHLCVCASAGRQGLHSLTQSVAQQLSAYVLWVIIIAHESINNDFKQAHPASIHPHSRRSLREKTGAEVLACTRLIIYRISALLGADKCFLIHLSCKYERII